MNEQKATMERLEGEVKASQVSQCQSLNELEVSVAGQLDMLADQWNEEIQKVTEQQKAANKSLEAQIKLLESGAAKPPHSTLPMISQPGGKSTSTFPALGGSQGDPISVAEIQGCRSCLVFLAWHSSWTS